MFRFLLVIALAVRGADAFSRMAVRMATVDPSRRVVVTGIGPVSGCGVGADAFFEALVNGETSIGPVTESFDASEYPCQIASEVRADQFNPVDYFNVKKSVRSTDRVTHLAMAASKLALQDAKLDHTTVVPERFGVIVGSAFGGMKTFEDETLKLKESGPRSVSPFAIPAMLGNLAPGVIAIELNAKGPNFSVISACATASHALGEAAQAIRNGEADVMLAGGAEAALTPLSFAGFGNMKAMCTAFNDDPARASRPFDKERSGFVMGEGAGVLCLESYEHAVARGAEIYCELAGYGVSCDAHHITSPAPDGAGLTKAIELCLADAGVEPTDIGYINAHGTSTPYNDKFESMAIKSAFGDHAYNIKISSTKSMTGHALGAAGGLEAAVCAKVMKTGKIPPTINLENPDLESGCDLDYVPNEMVEVDPAELKACISENLGFGGQNCALVFKQIA